MRLDLDRMVIDLSEPKGLLPWKYSDGGREKAGFSIKNPVGDCVVRAIAIAGEKTYQEVYNELAWRMKHFKGKKPGNTPRNGVPNPVIKKYMSDLGWDWTPMMLIGTGCQYHLRQGEVPDKGRFVVRLSGHVTALVNGVVHDINDLSRGGTRCVYGIWDAHGSEE